MGIVIENFSRRELLSLLGKAGAPALLLSMFKSKVWAKNSPDFFKLGVASGDPLPDGVVLWTRLAPYPKRLRGGMADRPVPVDWEMSTNSDMTSIVRRGTTTASPEMGHSVHVEVDGLKADHWYWYRFKAGSEYSPIGRTRTAPAAGSRVGSVRFAVASCQNFERGFYTAHRHIAAEDIQFVLFLGDYIYERKGSRKYVRNHGPFDVTSLDQYRARYAQYKSDPDLQACHAAFPWVVTWDDHEVADNYAGPINPKEGDSKVFLNRRAAAYQAYYENMPLRRSAKPNGPDMTLYRRLSFGNLLELNILDSRQYRTGPPSKGFSEAPGMRDMKASILGSNQEKWLFAGLQNSRAKWNAIAQQVLMFQRLHPKGHRRVHMDKWDGYPAARTRLLDFFRDRKISNPIILSGDVHSNWVADLKFDFDNPGSRIIGSEFVATSISSGGDGKNRKKAARNFRAKNPHIKFHDARRGYLRCEVTQDHWRTDIRRVEFVTEKNAPVRTWKSFIVKAGVAGVVALKPLD